jgi:hypothetical protein
MARKLLLACGVLSSLVYLSADVIGAMRWEGYSYLDQTISELAAIGSPSRPVTLALFTLYDVLLIPFAIGVAMTNRRGVREAGVMLAAIAGLGAVAAFFPIHVRGYQWTINETVHGVLTAITVFLIVSAMGLAARALPGGFRSYSMATLVATLVSGAMAGWIGRNLANDLPTPWIGVAERISVFAFLLWVAVLAIVLLNERRAAEASPGRDGMLAA